MVGSGVRRFLETTRDHGLFGAVGLSLHYFDYQLPRWFVHDYWGFPEKPRYELKRIDAEVDRINRTGVFPFPPGGENGVVGVGRGSWDRFTLNLERSALYRSMRMRYNEGTPWQHTPIYKQSRDKIRKGESGWGTGGSLSGLRRRCASVDQLFEEIKNNGYQPNEGETVLLHGSPIPDEVRLAVDRHGEFIRLWGGLHRLGVAKILDLERIPAVVQIEHRAWDRDVAVIDTISV